MNTTRVDTLMSVLRDLDPAPEPTLTDAQRGRADVALERILATPSPDQDPETSDRPHRRAARLLLPVGVAAAAAAAVPALLLGGDSAFASWTPRPESLSARAAASAATTCLATLQVSDRGERAVIAERRGGWTYVLVAGPESAGPCLMPDDLVSRQGALDPTEDGFFGGYTTDPVETRTLRRDRIDETESMTGNVPTPGLWPFTHDRESFTLGQGVVGSGVTAVTVHTPEGTDVEASVVNGRFAAWWPSGRPSSEDLAVTGAWTYTVTLADGSTRPATG